ncbi:hypothetical protein PPNSA23_09690 [Phyllobacterium phragmitis]|uniref:Lytic murein transglycosylase n=1 Tax=Phyllobacterium phragmitis TaxID=2670329 RepID=A0ABQ0GWI6_9HYPH
MMDMSRQFTPLWPAGHLPLKGGDYAFMDVRHQSQASQDKRGPRHQLISPSEGEMGGSPEGGVATRRPSYQISQEASHVSRA